jgi:hypothetical protein
MNPRLIYVALLALGSPLAAQPLSPDIGAYKAQGGWTDQGGHVGQWHAEGTLAGGRFTGTLAMEMDGVTRTVTLVPARASLKGGTCALYGENGRNRVEFRGACDDTRFGPGTLSGRFDGKALRGQFDSQLTTGAALMPKPPKSATAAPRG